MSPIRLTGLVDLVDPVFGDRVEVEGARIVAVVFQRRVEQAGEAPAARLYGAQFVVERPAAEQRDQQGDILEAFEGEPVQAVGRYGNIVQVFDKKRRPCAGTGKVRRRSEARC